MSSTYSETLCLRACDCDLFGRWLPASILVAMQETAGVHSALLGLDRNTMTSMNLAWVLSRVKVELKRIPSVNETIHITTYPTPQKHLFYPRVHVFTDANGNEIGYANSLWVLMDIAARRITQNAAVSQALPDNHDLPLPIGLPATVRPLEGEAATALLVPQYTDFDVNQHVNNTKYLNWCCNALGLDCLKNHSIQRFDVNYSTEVLPEMQVQTELVIKEDNFTFIGRCEKGLLFGISGQLQPWEN